jgi:hypothetical protein
MACRTAIAALGLAILTALGPTVACAASAELAGAKVCRKVLNVQGRAYSHKRLGYVLGCADKLLKCELLAEIDGVDPTGCRGAVTTACDARLGPDGALAKLGVRFDLKVGAVCQTPSFDYADVLSTGPGGLWYGNGACASEVDLPSFLPCLRDQIDARMDEIVSVSKPRTGILLDNAGLGGNFPHIARPPMTDQAVAATAPASGALVDPGTITVPLGNALRFTGDAGTLSCGSTAINGRVIITVGAGPTAQRHELREPYGPSEVAIFGPWEAATTTTYSIQLDDGTCDDTVSGTVSVP